MAGIPIRVRKIVFEKGPLMIVKVSGAPERCIFVASDGTETVHHYSKVFERFSVFFNGEFQDSFPSISRAKSYARRFL